MNSMKTVLLTICISFSISLSAQEREIQNIILFSRQSQIDSVRIYYPTATTLTNLEISGPDIKNLDSLIVLKKIIGDLNISQNPLLQSLRGLDKIQFVEGSFYIQHNNNLTDLRGLEKLIEVKEGLFISNNSKLKDLNGLEGLQRINKIQLNSNYVLESLHGLENLANGGWTYYLTLIACPLLTTLQAVENQKKLFGLNISQCDNLTNLNDFKKLQSVYGLRLFLNKNLDDISALHTIRNGWGRNNIDIQRNPRLKSLVGLDSLAGIDNLFIMDNDSLTTLEGLNHVDSVKSAIKIIGNRALSDISALSGVSKLGGELEIRDNLSLFICDYPFICEFIQYTTNLDAISQNLTSCNSIPAVITSCNFEGGQARGQVYLDMNCDEILDSNDYVLPHYIIEDVETHKPLIASDTAGRYIRYLNFNDSLEWRPRPLPRFFAHPLSQKVEVDSQPIDLDNLDFALCPDTLYHDVSVTLSPFLPIRPGYYSSINIGVQNKGTYVEKGVQLTLEFEVPPQVDSFVITSAEGNALIAGHSVIWNLSDLIPFQYLYIPVTLHVGPMTPIGIKIKAHVLIESLSAETNLQNNTALIEQKVVGSIDPNDKSVSRKQIRLTDQDSTLEYIIRFQNTGTFPATFIEVVDTIDASLDLSTLDMISASHDYVILFPEDNVIKWRFDNIQLPDSSSNELASHGYVHFSFKPSNKIDVEKGITNTASIYFDFNAPVLTTEAITKIDLTTSLYDEIGGHALNVWPNPVEDAINIQFDLESPSITTIQVYSIDGHIVYNKDLGFLFGGTQNAVINLRELCSGIYIIRLGTATKSFVRKVVMKKIP
jgi:uncharacterized repeat protein (TIGR01451 family)